MNVIHSCNTWLPLTQNWIWTQVASLPDDIGAYVVCREAQNSDAFPIQRIHQIPSIFTGRALLLRAVARINDQARLGLVIRRTGSRVVHSHFGPNGWRDSVAARLTGAAHVVTFYGHDVTRIPRSSPAWNARYQRMFKTATLILSEGQHMASEIVGLGCPSHKSRVHRLGIEIHKYRFEARQRDPHQPYRVLMAASFREKKGYADGIQALAHLANQFRIELTIAGDGAESARVRLIDDLIRCKLIGQTRMLGMVSHKTLIEEAHRHHIFLAPSITARDGDTEGGAPVAIIEMMATGMPVVSTLHCDIPNVVIDGETGYLAPEGDVRALAEQLRRAFQSQGRWAVLGSAARRRVEEEFDAAKQGRRLASLYQEALEARSPS